MVIESIDTCLWQAMPAINLRGSGGMLPQKNKYLATYLGAILMHFELKIQWLYIWKSLTAPKIKYYSEAAIAFAHIQLRAWNMVKICIGLEFKGHSWWLVVLLLSETKNGGKSALWSILEAIIGSFCRYLDIFVMKISSYFRISLAWIWGGGQCSEFGGPPGSATYDIMMSEQVKLALCS